MIVPEALAKFANIVYTKEKGGYKHAKVKYSKGIPGGGIYI